MHVREPSGQVARWIERLSPYQFKIQYRRGELHRNADTLSRIPCPEGCKYCQKTFPRAALAEEVEEMVPEEQEDDDIADPNGEAEQPQIEDRGETDVPEEVDELHVLWCAIRTLGDDPAPPPLGDLLLIPVNLFLIGEEVPKRGCPKIKRDLPLRVA